MPRGGRQPAPIRATDVSPSACSPSELRLLWQHASGQAQSFISKDDADMAEALRLSFEEAQRVAEASDAPRRLVSARLAALGLERKTTPADGNCQFIAVCESAGLAISPFELRQMVCTYMAERPDTFAGFLPAAPSGFGAYIGFMRKDGAWGDHLTLLAASLIIGRPVRVVNDALDDDAAIFTVPPVVNLNDWQDAHPVTIAHYAEVHYETTAPLSGDSPDQRPPGKRWKAGSLVARHALRAADAGGSDEHTRGASLDVSRQPSASCSESEADL